MNIIKWNKDGYPTEASLKRLHKAILGALKENDVETAKDIFYEALKENHYPDCSRMESVALRDEEEDVWAYHTLGWSGNESIISTLKRTWLFGWLLECYLKGGHFYFTPQKKGNDAK